MILSEAVQALIGGFGSTASKSHWSFHQKNPWGEDENQRQTQHFLMPDLEVKPKPSSVVIDKFSYYLALPPHTIYPKYNCSRIVYGEDFSKYAFVL